jgi:hypothetical protein
VSLCESLCVPISTTATATATPLPPLCHSSATPLPLLCHSLAPYSSAHGLPSIRSQSLPCSQRAAGSPPFPRLGAALLLACSSPAPLLSCFLLLLLLLPSGSSSGLLRLRPIFFPFSLLLPFTVRLHPPTQLAHTPPVALCTLSNLHHHRQRATTIRLTVPPPRFTSTAIFSSSFFPFPSLPYSYPPPGSIDHTSAIRRPVVVVQSRAVPFSQATSVLWIFVW